MLNIKELVYKKLKQITSNKFDEKSNIFEIGVDSLDLVELITEAEDELDITISDDALESIQTVGDVISQFKKAHDEIKKAKK